jgi:hypothetical protein
LVSWKETIVQPQKENSGLQRQEAAPKRAGQKQSLADSGSRGAAYIPKPEFAEEEKKPVPRGKLKHWAILGAAIGLLGLAAIEIPQWLQPHAQSDFVLTAADIDQVATANARESLRAGQIPPELASYPKQILQRIADGEESLYTKRLLPPEATEMRVHVTVSQDGAAVGDEVLTPEHPMGRSFPAGHGSPTHFHFTVEQPGPSHQVTCWLKSENSGVIYTKPMGQGESDDLQARAQ